MFTFLSFCFSCHKNTVKKEAPIEPEPQLEYQGPSVNIRHVSCRKNSDCVVIRYNCCQGISVNKKFNSKYSYKYDKSACAIVDCAEIKAVCEQNFCVIAQQYSSHGS